MNKSSYFQFFRVFSIIFPLLFLVSGFAISQEKYSVFGKVKIENGTFENTRITILKNAEKMESRVIDDSGKFEYKLEFGNEYILEFSKEGFVTKKVSISTFVPVEVLNRDSQFPPFKFMVSLFPAYEGLDLSVFDQPMGMIMYDKELDDFDYDREYDSQIRDAIKRAEEEARKRAAELEAQRLAKERAYKAAIQRGDINFNARKYDLSKAGYNEALNIKSEEEYPKTQLQKIEEILANQLLETEEQARLAAEQKALDEKYAAVIALADNQFSSGDYQSSRTSYTDALALKSAEAYPKTQISKIDEILANQQQQAEEAARLAADKKALDEKYVAVIALADNQFSSGDYQSSRTSYSDALALKSAEAYPKTQISKIDEILANQQQQAEEAARLAADKKALDEKYAAVIALADNQFSSGDYQSSRTSYSDALALKSAEAYPKSQISKIDELLAQQQQQAEEAARLASEKKALDEKYAAVIALGDSQFSSGDYQSSRTSYSDALALKSAEAYPKTQIAKIDEILANQQQQAEEAARLASEKKALDEKYAAVIALADNQFSSGDYQSSRTSYSDALALKSAEAYPKTQIAKIDEILANQQQQAEEAARLAADKKALDEKYAAVIALGDSQFSSGDYQSSRTSYTDALALKSAEAYPKNQIAKIDEILANQQQQAEEAARLAADKKALDEKYAAVIALADNQFSSGDYQSSRTSYSDALALKSAEAYPKTQISKIDELLAQQQQQAEEAARLASEKKALDEKYAAVIALADNQFSSGDYQSSRTSYTDALALKSAEAYPKTQISKIDEILASQQQQAEEAARLAADKKALDEKYAAVIALADNQFSSGDYQSSRTSYTDALALKSAEAYPKTQIAKIDELLAQQQRQSEEEERLLAEQKLKDAKYYNLIKSADKYFDTGQWQSAVQDYTKALNLKPEETYPKDRIEEIESILADLQRQENEKLALKNRYDELITDADQKFESEEYSLAVIKYEDALNIKPRESYPKNQIKRIEVLLEKKALADEKQKELDRKYGEELEKGEKFLQEEQFSVARHHYKAALSIKPGEEYPKEKLEEIAKRVEALKISEQEVLANNPANFEKKLSIIREREYASTIVKADESFKASQFTVAKVMYERALEMFDRDYPKKQLKEIDKLIKEDKNSHLTEEYRQLIAKGDKELEKNHYSVAKFYYQKATRLNSSEKYPENQLGKIAELLSSKKNQKLDAEYQEMIGKADDAYDKGSWSVARFYYRKAKTLKPNETYPKERLKLTQANQSKK